MPAAAARSAIAGSSPSPAPITTTGRSRPARAIAAKPSASASLGAARPASSTKPSGRSMRPAATHLVDRHGETRRRRAGDDPDPLAELRDLPELDRHRVGRHDDGIGVLDRALEHRPMPSDRRLRPLAGCVPRAEIPDRHHGLVVVVHAIVLHEGREERRRVDHAPADARSHSELQRGGQLPAGERGPTHAGKPGDLDRPVRWSGRRDGLDVAAGRRPGDQSTGEFARCGLEIGIGGSDELIEHHAKRRRHAAQPSGVGVGVGGCSACWTSSWM